MTALSDQDQSERPPPRVRDGGLFLEGARDYAESIIFLGMSLIFWATAAM